MKALDSPPDKIPAEKMQHTGLHPRTSPQPIYHVDVKAHTTSNQAALLPHTAPSANEPDTHNTVVRYSLTTRLLACLSYGFTSVSITLFNKAVFAIYHFHYPNLVTTLQILVSITYMWVLRSGGVLSFSNVTAQSARQVLPLAFFWWLYVVSGVTALRYLNVPMYSTLRRITTLVIALGEVQLFNKSPSKPASLALVFMVAGAVVAGCSDLTFNLPGYLWMGILIFSTATYLLLIKMLGDKAGLNQATLLWHNNILGLPIMLLYLVGGTNELRDVVSYPQLTSVPFWFFLVLSASQAFLLNLCIFKCTTINSPLATSVTGQIKDILTMGLGLLLFHDVSYHPVNVLGLVVGFCGGAAYSAVSFQEQRARDAAKRAMAQALANPRERKQSV